LDFHDSLLGVIKINPDFLQFWEIPILQAERQSKTADLLVEGHNPTPVHESTLSKHNYPAQALKSITSSQKIIDG
jgi:hypothetical protein